MFPWLYKSTFSASILTSCSYKMKQFEFIKGHSADVASNENWDISLDDDKEFLSRFGSAIYCIKCSTHTHIDRHHRKKNNILGLKLFSFFNRFVIKRGIFFQCTEYANVGQKKNFTACLCRFPLFIFPEEKSEGVFD